MRRRYYRELFPANLGRILLHDWTDELAEDIELVLRHAADRAQDKVVCCYGVAESYCCDGLVALQGLNLCCCLYHLTVCVLQEEVKIVQLRRILVFESTQQLLLDYTQLICSVFKGLVQ